MENEKKPPITARELSDEEVGRAAGGTFFGLTKESGRRVNGSARMTAGNISVPCAIAPSIGAFCGATVATAAGKAGLMKASWSGIWTAADGYDGSDRNPPKTAYAHSEAERYALLCSKFRLMMTKRRI